MGKVIIAVISTVIVTILGGIASGDFFFYYIIPAAIVGTIVGVGAVLYSKMDDLGKPSGTENSGFDELIKLRDIGLLSDTELEDAIELVQNKSAIKETYEQYQAYERTLTELKKIGFLNEEQYAEKSDSLKMYFEEKL